MIRHLFQLPLGLLALLHTATCFEVIVPPSSTPSDQEPLSPSQGSSTLEFTLQYIFHHGTENFGLHRRAQVGKNAQINILDHITGDIQVMPKLKARSQTLSIQRLQDRSQKNIDYILDTGRMTGRPVALDASSWTIADVHAPDHTDQETVLSLARMAANAYVSDQDKADWVDVGNGFNFTNDFGWENDGLRGHVFADETNQTVVVAVKGTSPAVFDGSGTTTNDKMNDNLFFSCCCGQGGRYGWLQVCDCQTSAFNCNSTCVTQALKEKNRYYYAGQEIYRNVSQLYPNADIWLTGHSLGGATVSLVALTYGVPVVTFEAPGEAMPAARLALPTPPGYHIGSHQRRLSTGGFHFGHTADPIFMGTCNTYSSVCTIAGYAMQSVCHTGQTCAYDTVKDFGWRVSSTTHKIGNVIKDVLEKYSKPAKCAPVIDCTDCFNWEFYESNRSDTTTTKLTTTTTPTPTSTCKTPGWWGCLDESTSNIVTTSIDMTTTSATSTCHTPGWFGCKDKTNDCATSTSPVPETIPTSAPISTSCHYQNSFSATAAHSHSVDAPQPTTLISTQTESPRPISSFATSSLVCIGRSWLGQCLEWAPADMKLDFHLAYGCG